MLLEPQRQRRHVGVLLAEVRAVAPERSVSGRRPVSNDDRDGLHTRLLAIGPVELHAALGQPIEVRRQRRRAVAASSGRKSSAMMNRTFSRGGSAAAPTPANVAARASSSARMDDFIEVSQQVVPHDDQVGSLTRSRSKAQVQANAEPASIRLHLRLRMNERLCVENERLAPRTGSTLRKTRQNIVKSTNTCAICLANRELHR